MSIRENIEALNKRVAEAAARVGRTPDEITIVAVAKTFPVEKILEAVESGIRIIGENRVQEAKQKFVRLGNVVEWHMVGHLQTNKVKDALKIFRMIHSLDSIRLAREIDRRAEKPIDCLIEVNTSQEPSKFGIKPNELIQFYEALHPFKQLNIVGLMTIGPGWAIQDPEASRSCFRLLRELRDELARAFDQPFPILSMGMTSDFEVAIEEGSNLIRVGTAIFGPRDYKCLNRT
ncbi:YggS family pyridoxal phosphate enzyme [candidate division WOR-3 bacterium 4484_100]|uniref:Pyridoxal phosphate homeostasis protein n=1 Tax=candidate division WOR-3 bacterium 4484_100 TaxID=1936077 RepID=A0A1V4QFV7_UNCW3|nr:MAG: YggS family pyridoxal phosphate enzyme [candidate division WOR-3 bacterium 4484_100]